MLPYFLLLFTSVAGPLIVYQKRGMFSLNDRKSLIYKRNKMTICFFFLGLFILLALRDISVGKDLNEYERIFRQCYRTSFENLPSLRWEIGYSIYNKILAMITKEYRFLLIVTAAITLVPIYKLYSKEKKYSFLLIILFMNMPCFLMIFSGLRQAIAISIGIITYMLLENKRYGLSALTILLAMCFHTSAFVLVLLYPAYFFKITTKHLFYIVPVMLTIYLYRVPIFSFIMNFLPSSYVEFYGEIQLTGAIGMMLLFLIFTVFSFVVLDEKVISKRDYFMRNVLLIATIFQFFVPVHGWVQRASYYFLIFVPVSILSIVQAPKKRFKKVSNLAVVVMGCFFLMYFFYNASFSTDNLLNVFPYKFFWSN